MTLQVQATHTLEIEITVTGTYQPSIRERGPSYSSGGEPAEPAMIEDLDIEGIAGLRWVGPSYNPKLMGSPKWIAVDLLSGVDRSHPIFRQIVANLIAFCGADAEQLLIGEAEE